MPSASNNTPNNGSGSGSARPRTMTPSATIRFLEDRPNMERSRPARLDPDEFKLDRIRAILAGLGDPHHDLKFVHVAGSKGKGSTVEMVASSLTECGYAVGVFTSPHLIDVRERIRMGREMISESAFSGVMSKVRAACERVTRSHGEATYFEILTAGALVHFAEQAVDLAVLETGLGGRLDCTNVVVPEVCGLTEIQLEHTDILGTDLREIAREKAGIMKPGVTAISVPQAPEVIEVFREVAGEVGAALAVLGDDIDYTCRFEATHDRGPHARVSVSTQRSEFEHISSPFSGEHQAPNCGLALAMLDRLRERGFHATERDVAVGIGKTEARGRQEMVYEQPMVMIDGAHNPESIRELVRSLGSRVGSDSMVVVFGCAADKDVDAMLEQIARGADKMIFTRARDNPRAMDPAELASRFESISGKMAQHEATLTEALNTAARAVAREDLILVTGSFFLAGEAKRLLESKRMRAG